MTGFSADWLALREAADKASRSAVVLKSAGQAFAGHGPEPMTICDLGSGTGASVTAFANLFPRPQRWRLVDADSANLDRALARFSGPRARDGIAVEVAVHDLADKPAPWHAGTDLVTATALFDLVSPKWLKTLAGRLAAERIALLATLSYDGRLTPAPEHPLDEAMIHGFNRHQQGDKGFGPAAGPLAAALLTSALEAHGYDIVRGDSAWRLDGTRDHELIGAILTGWADTATELELLSPAAIADWRSARLRNTRSLIVGHTDFFAVMPFAKME